MHFGLNRFTTGDLSSEPHQFVDDRRTLRGLVDRICLVDRGVENVPALRRRRPSRAPTAEP